ncbi:DUF664 domain-containing protein [Rhodococcus sp. NPDC006774]|uniref:mycothiol transferase n=1 Tax=Rhodococcus sp. NPDC006774 TaxID=3157186 RepID=UPI0033F1BC6A
MTDRRKTWTAPTPEPVDGPLFGDERPILEGTLQWHRATLLNICAGANSEQLARRPFPPSTLSLLGLVRHLAKVERIWFRERLGAMSFDPMYDAALGKDSDFLGATEAGAESDFAQFLPSAVPRTRLRPDARWTTWSTREVGRCRCGWSTCT